MPLFHWMMMLWWLGPQLREAEAASRPRETIYKGWSYFFVT
jgi:hypothetical protein